MDSPPKKRISTIFPCCASIFHERVQSLIEGDYVGIPLRRQHKRRVQFHSKVRTAFGGCTAASIVDENLTHQAGCYRREMCSIVGFKRSLIDESKICLVDQSSTLRGVCWALALKMVVRDFAQFLVDKRNQYLESPPIPGSPSRQEFAYGLRRHVHSGDLGKR